MTTIKIYETDWVLPIIYSTRQVIVHLNPHNGTNQLGSKWHYCVTLYDEKTPAIIRLSNIKHAKRCAREFDNYLTVNCISSNNLNSQNLEQLLKFRDFVTSFIVDNNIKAYIRR
jgi:patatin-like phospholipase/acyl hydrolase